MKAAIYSRKSKFSMSGDSIENQIQLCKEHMTTHLKQLKIDEYIEYEDEGYSGGNINRPAFQRLIEDAKNKKFDILICYRLDRISRNVSDFSTTLTLLQNYNIDFISIREQFDTTSPMGRAMIYIASVFAQLERETIAERVRDNMLELSKTGRWLGGVTPIGYESESITYLDETLKERKMTKLIQVSDELKIVRLIFEKYLELKSLSKVETYMLQNRFTTRRGGYFDKTKLRVILTNPVYVKSTQEVFDYLKSLGVTVCGNPDNKHGLLRYNKQKAFQKENGKIVRLDRDMNEWVAAVSSHKGIIEGSDWIKVQETLFKNKDRNFASARSHHAILTGILRCGKCNSPMRITHGRPSTKTGEKIYYYTCSLKKNSKGSLCDCKNKRTDDIDTVVTSLLKSMAGSKELLIKQLKEKIKKSTSEKTIADKSLKIKKEIEDKNRKINSLMDKLAVDDDITDLIIAKIKNIKKEISNLNEELLAIENNNLKQDEENINISYIELLLNKCSLIDTLDVDETRELIRGLIREITWNSDTNEIDIDPITSEASEESKKK